MLIYNLFEIDSIVKKLNRGWGMFSRMIRQFNHDKARPIDWEFLEIWSSDLAYFLGFLAGDGSLSTGKDKDGFRIYSVSVRSKDLDLLEFFRKKFAKNHKISVDRTGCGILQMKRRNVYEKLIQFNVKSPNIFDITPKKYLPSFIRGFFDAEGHVRIRGNKCIEASFVQKDKAYLEKLANIFKSWKMNSHCLYQLSNKCWVLSFNTKSCYIFAKKIYKFYDDIYFLKRKYRIFKKIFPDVNPIYEYVCPIHGKFELLRPIREFDELGQCPKCGELCEKQLSRCNFKVPPWHTSPCPEGSCNIK